MGAEISNAVEGARRRIAPNKNPEDPGWSHLVTDPFTAPRMYNENRLTYKEYIVAMAKAAQDERPAGSLQIQRSGSISRPVSQATPAFMSPRLSPRGPRKQTNKEELTIPPKTRHLGLLIGAEYLDQAQYIKASGKVKTLRTILKAQPKWYTIHFHPEAHQGFRQAYLHNLEAALNQTANKTEKLETVFVHIAAPYALRNDMGTSDFDILFTSPHSLKVDETLPCSFGLLLADVMAVNAQKFIFSFDFMGSQDEAEQKEILLCIHHHITPYRNIAILTHFYKELPDNYEVHDLMPMHMMWTSGIGRTHALLGPMALPGMVVFMEKVFGEQSWVFDNTYAYGYNDCQCTVVLDQSITKPWTDENAKQKHLHFILTDDCLKQDEAALRNARRGGRRLSRAVGLLHATTSTSGDQRKYLEEGNMEMLSLDYRAKTDFDNNKSHSDQQIHGLDDVLELIDTCLLHPPHPIIYIHGLEGSGKMAAAYQFIVHQGVIQPIRWCCAKSRLTLQLELYRFALQLGLVEDEDGVDGLNVKKLLFEYLTGMKDWLIVYTGCTDIADIMDLCPPNTGLTMMTSTQPVTPTPLVSVVEVDQISTDHGARIINNVLNIWDPSSISHIKHISTLLGANPMACSIAAAHLGRKTLTLPQYIKELDPRFASRENPHPQDRAEPLPNPMLSAVQMAVSSIQSLNHQAAILLRCMSWLDGYSMPIYFLKEFAKHLADDESSGFTTGRTDVPLTAQLNYMADFNLLRFTTNKLKVVMNKAVQNAVNLGDPEPSVAYCMTVRTLSSIINRSRRNPKVTQHPMCYCYPHIQSLVDEREKGSPNAAVEVLLIKMLQEAGRFCLYSYVLPHDGALLLQEALGLLLWHEDPQIEAELNLLLAEAYKGTIKEYKATETVKMYEEKKRNLDYNMPSSPTDMIPGPSGEMTLEEVTLQALAHNESSDSPFSPSSRRPQWVPEHAGDRIFTTSQAPDLEETESRSVVMPHTPTLRPQHSRWPVPRHNEPVSPVGSTALSRTPGNLLPAASVHGSPKLRRHDTEATYESYNSSGDEGAPEETMARLANHRPSVVELLSENGTRTVPNPNEPLPFMFEPLADDPLVNAAPVDGPVSGPSRLRRPSDLAEFSNGVGLGSGPSRARRPSNLSEPSNGVGLGSGASRAHRPSNLSELSNHMAVNSPDSSVRSSPGRESPHDLRPQGRKPGRSSLLSGTGARRRNLSVGESSRRSSNPMGLPDSSYPADNIYV